MTQPIRFLFDECISWKVVEGQLAASLELYSPGAVLAHLRKKFTQGIKDRVWIPQIAEEGGWIIISMDRGKHSNVPDRLPLICQQFHVTHATLSGGLAKRSMYFRATAIEACWPALVSAGSEPSGTGFRLSMKESASGVVSFRLQKIYSPSPPDQAPPVQRNLPLDPDSSEII